MDVLRWVILGAALVVAVVGVILFTSVGVTPGASPENNNAPQTNNNSPASAVLLIDDASISASEFSEAYEVLLENYARFYEQFGQDFTQQLEGEAGAYYQLELRSQLVDQLIRDTLIEREIKRRGIAVSQAEIEAEFETEYNSILTQNDLTEASADELLRQQGSSLEQFKQELREQVGGDLRQQQLVERITGPVSVSDVALVGFVEDSNFVYIERLTDVEAPTEADVRAYYDANPNEFRQIKARHILIRVEEDAPAAEAEAALVRITDIRSRIESGEDFVEVAKATSEDTVSGAQGGDLGYFGEGVMVRPFEQAAFSLAIGELSAPVRSPFGYHLILVEEERAQPFEEVAEAIHGQLLQARQQEAFEALLSQAKRGDAVALARFREVAAADFIEQRRAELFELWFEDVMVRAEIQVRLPAVAAYRLEAVDLQQAINAYERLRDNGQDPQAGYYLCQVYLRRFDLTQARIAELEAIASPTPAEQDELGRLQSAIGLFEAQANSC